MNSLVEADEIKTPVDPARSALMSRVRQKDTTPEIVVRKILHANGFRFRLHRRDLPGTPDIVLPKHNLAILVHGCFWHGHAECSKGSIPKTRTAFWSGKIKKNQERDIAVLSELEGLGWHVHVIWECETKEVDTLRRRLTLLFSQGRPVETGYL